VQEQLKLQQQIPHQVLMEVILPLLQVFLPMYFQSVGAAVVLLMVLDSPPGVKSVVLEVVVVQMTIVQVNFHRVLPVLWVREMLAAMAVAEMNM
jgi:Kef-type K+ transport system membrane component KefB